ncbi:MAG: peptidylprolyl isomerase [Pseudolabrys sp.]|jgi:peptidyl-prolyl cis-trans isomerase C
MSCTVHAQLPTGRPVNVSVNGVSIARDEIVREMQHHPAGKPIAAWQQAARALVIRELLMQEARKLAIEPQPLTEDGRRETDEEAIMRGLIDREVVVPRADDETCRRYYQRHPSQFRSPDIYEAAHILFAARPADKDAYAAARAEAEGVLAALIERPESFATMTEAYSACSSAAHGGNLGQITTGQTTPEFEQALVALAPGALCAEPVATRYGFHIIRLDRKHDGRLLPYELVAGRIADYLNESVRRRADAQYIARLVSAAKIEGIDLADADALRVH